jgi:hypothetical protein
MTEQLDYHKIYAQLDAGWTDITNYVTSSIKGFWGINGNTVFDRVASAGEMKFELDNTSGSFTPDVGTVLAGWEMGIQVKFVVSYDGVEKTKFIGRISEIDIDPTPWGERKVGVTVLDWMNNASITNVALPTVLLNKTINDGVLALLPFSSVQPSEVDYDSYGVVSTFPTIFDNVSTRTKMLSELSKLAQSEFGFVYLRHHGANGEILVTEGRQFRNSTKTQLQVPLEFALCDNLELEGWGKGDLELEDGINPLTLNEVETLTLAGNETISADIKNGSRIVTDIRVNTYPRRVDTTLTVIFAITQPISMGGGETKTFRSYYLDPYGSHINATNQQTPVATTDYLMYANSDGTGTNLTANLAVTATYGAEAIDYSLTNSGAAGYVTFLQARGFGIYSFNSITYHNTASTLATYGELTQTVDMKYQDDVAVASFLGDLILNSYGVSANTLESIECLANLDPTLMMAFVYMDIGDLIGVSVNQVGISGTFFIQSLNFEVTPAGIITFRANFTDALTLSDAYWELEVAGKSELNTTTILGI